MNPRNRRKAKILKAVTAIAIIVWFMSAMCLDADSWIPTILCGASMIWTFLIVIANTKGD